MELKDFHPQIQRAVTKATSVRALCLVALTLTLCGIVAFHAVDQEWRRVVEAVIMALLGNYLGRASTPPQPPGGVA